MKFIIKTHCLKIYTSFYLGFQWTGQLNNWNPSCWTKTNVLYILNIYFLTSLEVFSALDDQTQSKPILSNENMLINELIRDYLEFNKYKYTNTVLLAESGQPKDPIDRSFLAAELNITETASSEKLPILYGLVSYFLEQRNSCRPEKDVGSLPPPSRSSQVHQDSACGDLSVSSVNDQPPSRKGLVYHSKK